jgi:hypothetical protein
MDRVLRLGVLLGRGKIEEEVRFDEGLGWDMKNRDLLVGVTGEVVEFDLRETAEGR